MKELVTGLLALFIVSVAAYPQGATGGGQGFVVWKMNPAKSKYSPGPEPKNFTVKIQSDANEIKLFADGTNADGNPTRVEYQAKFDGKDYPIIGWPNADTVSVKRVDDYTTVSTLKKGNQVVITVHSSVSKDGKTRTSIFEGKDAQGHEVRNVVVYDRQ